MPSSSHQKIAQTLKKLLAPEKIYLEKRFHSIGRIADLVWERKKLVFEIQCSFIDTKEVRARIADYESIGYDVIWLLDEACFNKTYLKPSEILMRERGGKYVALKGEFCVFYDQIERRIGRKVVYKSRPMPCKIANPYLKTSLYYPLENIPKSLKAQWLYARYLFPGQFLDLFTQNLAQTLPVHRSHFMPALRKMGRQAKLYLNFFINYYVRKTYKH